MACAIKILTVTATRVPPQTKANTVTVGGTAVECGQVTVTVSGAQSASKIAIVDPNSNNWAVTLDTSALGCTCDESISVQAACVEEPTCRAETSVVLECAACPSVDQNLGVIIHLKPVPKCLDKPMPAQVTLTAKGPFGAGNYHWDFKDGTTETTTVPSVPHQFNFPGTYIVELNYDPDEEGCPPTDAYGLVHIPRCGPGETLVVPTHTDVKPKTVADPEDTPPVEHPKPLTPPEHLFPETDVKPSGGGRFDCDALLVGAIALLLAGGLAIVIGVCSKFPWVIIGGAAGAVLGLILFLVWLGICGKITSCDVMQTMYRLLRFIILFGGPFLALAGVAQAAGVVVDLDKGCWAAILGYYGSIAFLKEILGDVMTDAGCPPPRSLF